MESLVIVSVFCLVLFATLTSEDRAPALPKEIPPYPVAANIEFAEGPIIDSLGNLYFVNYVRNGTLGRMTPDRTVTVWFETGGQVNGLKAAALHLVASSRNFAHASDSAYGLVSDDYITHPFEFDQQACLSVPYGPGVGVELDQEKIERYSRLEGEDCVFAAGPGDRFIPRSRMIL